MNGKYMKLKLLYLLLILLFSSCYSYNSIESVNLMKEYIPEACLFIEENINELDVIHKFQLNMEFHVNYYA